MNLPKGTTLDNDIVLTDNNHNENGNPHAQYCKSINKSIATKAGYNLIYKKTFTITSHCIVISGKALSTIADTPSFDFLCQLTYRNSTLGKVSKTGSDKIKFCYKQSGNSFDIQIFLQKDGINENYFIIPSMDFSSSITGDDYMFVVPPSPLLGGTGFKFSSTTDYMELPSGYMIV